MVGTAVLLRRQSSLGWLGHIILWRNCQWTGLDLTRSVCVKVGGSLLTHRSTKQNRTLLLSASSPPSLIKLQDRILCADTPSASKKGVIGTKLQVLYEVYEKWSCSFHLLAKARGWQQICSAGETVGSCEAFAGWERNQEDLLRLTAEFVWVLAYHFAHH